MPTAADGQRAVTLAPEFPMPTRATPGARSGLTAVLIGEGRWEVPVE
jgi:hypothetical protein